MSFEVQCGTNEMCNDCPMKDYESDRAQELGTIAACYAEDDNISSDIVLNRLADVVGTEVTKADRARVRMAVVNMSLGKCEIKEI